MKMLNPQSLVRELCIVTCLLAPLVLIAQEIASGKYPETGSYQVEQRQVALVDGHYEDINGSLSVAESTRGDINGDGLADLLVVLVQNSRGSGVFYYLNVLLADVGGGYSVSGEVFLGDRIRIDAVAVEDNPPAARVELRVRGDDQPYAAPPEQPLTRWWRVTDGMLTEYDPRAEQAAGLLAPFKKDLKAALLAGLAKGPAAAIDACKLEAPAIARRLSTNGVVVGRSSHRLRNPANAVPGWVSPVIAEYLDEDGGWQARLVELEAGRRGYVEPIALQPLCATCHGKAVSPEITERIAVLYPEDAATGFEVGDLRGVFWLEF